MKFCFNISFYIIYYFTLNTIWSGRYYLQSLLSYRNSDYYFPALVIHLISSVISITTANAENIINLEKTEAVLLELPCCMAAGCSPVIHLTIYIWINVYNYFTSDDVKVWVIRQCCSWYTRVFSGIRPVDTADMQLGS